ncbi:ferredoxin--NADP reductase [Streptomyces xanthochromogenes]|uniref:ferredoxin--NADP reductase n=1 Tax=Streptomyces xanthochromogenes TaxID=67384 RepID=UPI00342FFF41
MSRASAASLVQLSIDRVVDEGQNVKTFVLEPAPGPMAEPLTYRAGQFLTLRLPVAAERPVMRSYSISTCPVSDPRLAITVKRNSAGAGSNWLYEQAAPGMTLEALPPAGHLTLDGSDSEILLFAAGVGITPLYSLCKYALASTDRHVRLHYSSRHRESTPFIASLEKLERAHSDRLRLDLRMTGADGRLDAEAIASIVSAAHSPTSYVCGPVAYTMMVVDGLIAAGHPPHRIRTDSSGPVPRTP